jgi:protein-tyrosine phosphatase
MAQALAEDMFRKQNKKIEVHSCGIFAAPGSPAALQAVLVLQKEYGVNMSGHQSRPVRYEDLEVARLVLTMATGHKEHLTRHYPQFAAKIQNLGKDIDGNDKDVKDPFGGSLDIYKECAAEIKACLEEIKWEDYI